MPARSRLQQQLDELLSRYEKSVAKAFLAAIADLKTVVDLQRVITALKAGDLEAAITALHPDPAAFNALHDAVQGAYGDAGTAAAADLSPLPGTRVVVRFNARNHRAEAWLKDRAAQLVTRVVDEQRQSIRTVLTNGLAAGEPPRTMALGIVGQMNRATGKREGGILGLSAPHTAAVTTARAELASTDPDGLRNYLTRARRDKRFDRTILRALKDGKPVPADIADQAVIGYERRLLKLRGDIIGRTETLTALNAAQHENLLQLVEKGLLSEAGISRIWRSAGDLRVRHSHMALNGDKAGLRQAFRSPSGAHLMYPGDTSLGAPASEVIGCRCVVTTKLEPPA